MKIKDYKPKNEEESIGWLMEEAREVILEIGRCMRFGYDNVHEGRTNRHILLDEMDDLRYALDEATRWLEKDINDQMRPVP
jgi:hypothetical protein